MLPLRKVEFEKCTHYVPVWVWESGGHHRSLFEKVRDVFFSESVNVAFSILECTHCYTYIYISFQRWYVCVWVGRGTARWTFFRGPLAHSGLSAVGPLDLPTPLRIALGSRHVIPE